MMSLAAEREGEGLSRERSGGGSGLEAGAREGGPGGERGHGEVPAVEKAKPGLILLANWQAEMGRRGKMDCKFVCPSCGNTASPNDFKAAGADHQRAPVECIGRVKPKVMAGGEFEAGSNGGCDWAAFGLIDICIVHIDLGDKQVPVFAFAESKP